MNDRSRLYYEAHITLEPVEAERHKRLEVVSKNHGMRVSTFLMVKDDDPIPDAFTSMRDESFASISVRMVMAMNQLHEEGFVIKRFKIEDTLLDSKRGDVLGGFDRTPRPGPFGGDHD